MAELKLSVMEIDDMASYDMKPRGLCGLTNIGNTCYMNSALQALSNCPQLTSYFLSCGHLPVSSENLKSLVAKQYKDLMTEMWHRKRPKHVTPSSLMRAIRIHNPTFRGYAQQDTQELLRCLMDQLHEELKKPIIDVKKIEKKHFADVKLDEDGDSSNESSMDMDHSETESKRIERGQTQRKLTETCLLLDPTRRKTPPKNKMTAKKKVKQVSYRSIITSVFDGKLLSSVQCLTCNRVGYAAEASPKPCGTSQIEPCVKIVNDEKPLIISHLRCLAEF